MRRLFLNGFTTAAVLLILPLSASRYVTLPDRAPRAEDDPRLASLQRFFAAADCPVQHLSAAFLNVADLYQLDWRLLPSIAFVESTGGKAARNNNLFGWKSGRAAFPSMKAAIYHVAYYLANSTLYRHKNIDQILATYNPDSDYAKRVKFVMRKIGCCQR